MIEERGVTPCEFVFPCEGLLCEEINSLRIWVPSRRKILFTKVVVCGCEAVNSGEREGKCMEKSMAAEVKEEEKGSRSLLGCCLRQ